MKTHRLRNLWLGILLGLSLAAVPARAAVEVGAKAPDFALPASTAREIRLADFAGKKNVVLFFYIGAFTNA